MAAAIHEHTSDGDKPLVIEGKRQRKAVECFSITHKPKPVAKYEGGNGTKLGAIPSIEGFISRSSAADLRPLHRLCLDRPGTKLEIKKNLRGFSGFTFSKDSDQFKRKKTAIDKFQKSSLKLFLDILGLHRSGSKEEQVNRVLDFLLSPTDSGKPAPAKKRRTSKSAMHSKEKTSKKSSKPIKKSKRSPKITESSDEEGMVPFDDQNESGNEDIEDQAEGDDGVTAPTDSELFDIVKKILKTADLESVTNNSICKQTFERFPGIDLTGKKDYLKSCIRKVLALT